MVPHGSPLARPQSNFDGSQLPALSGWDAQIQLLFGKRAGQEMQKNDCLEGEKLQGGSQDHRLTQNGFFTK